MQYDLESILKTYWKYDSFRPMQKDIIMSVLEGKDTLALLPTGGGKSIIYQIAGMAREGLCLVITPIISLMKDQVEDLTTFGIKADAIHSGMNDSEIASVINKALYSKIKFLYVAPERLSSFEFKEKLAHMPLNLIAVDEAHCISQWGYDFRPSYLRIAEIRKFFPDIPVIALTATATAEVCEDIQKHLAFKPPAHVFEGDFMRKNLSYVARETDDKRGELVRILSRMKGDSAIVYVGRRKTAEELSEYLCRKGFECEPYHAGLSPVKRNIVQENWKKNHIPVIVATNAFGMGIDKADVRLVVHFDVPDNPEAYFQESGRAGRDGRKSYAVTLYNKSSVAAMRTGIAKKFPDTAYIKRVYKALGNYFQIAEGAGKGYSYEFHPEEFVRNFKLDRTKMFSSVEILKLSGYIEYTVDINLHSRIIFNIKRDELYHIPYFSPLQEKLVEILMRKYPGIFSSYVYVNETEIADSTNSDRDAVYKNLIEISRRKLIDYIPGNDHPYIVYLMPRMPEGHISIPSEVYKKRKQCYKKRVETMIGYLQNPGNCRQVFLTRYFGQKKESGCGICDLCIKRKKEKQREEELSGRIESLIRQGEGDIKKIVNHFPIENRDAVIDSVRILLDKGTLYYTDPDTIGYDPHKKNGSENRSPE